MQHLNIFNRKISEATFESEQSLIETFYAGVREWTEQAVENTAEDMGRLQFLWSHYKLNLPRDKKELAEQLSYLVIYQSQDLPKSFTYQEILKAVFLIMLPDLLAQKYLGISLRGQRDDDLFGMISVTEKEACYSLMANKDARPQVFETFVAHHEIQQDTASSLKKFEDHFKSTPHLDRYTQQDFSLMLQQEVLECVNVLLSEKKIFQAIGFNVLDLNTYINLIHNLIGWSISTYLQEKQRPAEVSEEEATLENAFVQRNFQERNQQETARAMSRTLTSFRSQPIRTATIADAINAYNQTIWLNISLGVAPAITSVERDWQNLTYPVHVHSRATLLANDIYYYAAARAQLGLEEDENHERFICDHFSFSDEAFCFSQPIETLNLEQILGHFFIASADFLRHINRNRCDRIIFDITLHRLWLAFMNDPRFTAQLSLDHNFNHENSTLTTLCDFFHTAPLEHHVFLQFYTLLEKVAKEYPLLLPILSQAVLNHSKTQPVHEKTREEEYVILHLLEKTKHLNLDTQTLKSMYMLLNCDFLSARNRLCFIGIIAEKRSTEPLSLQNFTALADKDVVIQEIFSSAIGAEVFNRITHIINETSLSRLMDWYTQAQTISHPVPVLIRHIELHCSRTQLETLKMYLEKFSTLRKTSQLFSKLVGAENIQTVMNKIDQKQPAADILFSLKNSTKSKLHILARNQEPVALYQAIDNFFSVDTNGMSDLLDAIHATLPSSTSFELLEL